MLFHNTIIQYLDTLECIPSIIFEQNGDSLFSIMFNIKKIDNNRIELFNITCQQDGSEHHFVSYIAKCDRVVYNYETNTIEKNAYLNDICWNGTNMSFSEFIKDMYGETI